MPRKKKLKGSPVGSRDATTIHGRHISTEQPRRSLQLVGDAAPDTDGKGLDLVDVRVKCCNCSLYKCFDGIYWWIWWLGSRKMLGELEGAAECELVEVERGDIEIGCVNVVVEDVEVGGDAVDEDREGEVEHVEGDERAVDVNEGGEVRTANVDEEFNVGSIVAIEDAVHLHDSDNDIEDDDEDVNLPNMPPHNTWTSSRNLGNSNTCMGYSFTVDSDYEDSNDLREFSSDSDGEHEEVIRFNTQIDMHDPKFAVGMVFESFDVLKRAIRTYSIKERFPIQIKKNDRQRVRAECAEHCPWTLYATAYKDVGCVQIRTLVDEHTCVRGFHNKYATYLWIADAYYDVLRLNPETKVGQLMKYIQRDYNIFVDRAKVARGRRHALAMLRGDEKEQYTKLADYAAELRRTNNNSTCILSLDSLVFRKMFICLAPCKLGFITGCRPIIFLDGCFLKGLYGGQLLTAVGVDANDGIWPIAYAVVDVECRESWQWFLQLLGEELGIENSHAWTFMSDRQKVHLH